MATAESASSLTCAPPPRRVNPALAVCRTITWRLTQSHPTPVALDKQVLSDNNNRATADVNMIVSKTGCKSASAGSVRLSLMPRMNSAAVASLYSR
eukprot:701226-Pleurochrysis_carterae.AAC.1